MGNQIHGRMISRASYYFGSDHFTVLCARTTFLGVQPRIKHDNKNLQNQRTIVIRNVGSVKRLYTYIGCVQRGLYLYWLALKY